MTGDFPMLPKATPAKTRITRFILAVVLTVIAYTVVQSAFFLLGPWSNPKFAKMNWTHMDISYRVRTDPRRGVGAKRTFEITDQAIIDSLRQSLNIEDVAGDPLGGHGQIKITVADDTVWLVDIVFENRVDFCLARDNYYSYIATLGDSHFYRALRSLCLKNEQKRNPHATIDHIQLLENMGVESYPILVE